MKGLLNNQLTKKLTRKHVVISLTLLMLLATIFFVLKEPEPLQSLHDYLQYRVNPYVFLLLMLLLPIVGVPISVFLVLVGMKFDVAGGLFFSALLMSFHMVCTYYLVHSFLRDWIIKWLKSLNLLPFAAERVSPSRWHLFLFMLVPGLPYAVKNNLLALSGIPFGPYLLINWTAQFGLSIPLVLAGTAVMDMDPAIIASAVFMLIIILLLQRYAKQKYHAIMEKRSNSKEVKTK